MNRRLGYLGLLGVLVWMGGAGCSSTPEGSSSPEARFNRMDVNGDDCISWEEFAAAEPQPPPPRRGPPPPKRGW